MFEDILVPGNTLEASAHQFAEFSLHHGDLEILRLRSVVDPDTESIGGIAYQCECLGERCILHFFRTPHLQRESYKIVCGESVTVTTEVFRQLHTVDIVFSDGKAFQCRVGLLGLEVYDSEGNRLVHTSPRIGLIMGASTVRIDHAMEEDIALPLLMILTHASTHTSR